MDTKQAYQQMGHAKKSEMRRSGAIGATPGEIYHMCLQKHVSRTLYHDPHPLRYQAGEKFSETEVPACAIELTLPVNSKWQLIVAETEPIAHTSCRGDNVSVSQKWQEDIRWRFDGYVLLADPSVYTIREKKEEAVCVKSGKIGISASSKRKGQASRLPVPYLMRLSVLSAGEICRGVQKIE